MAGFKDLKGQGHAPTLFMAFLYFDMSFMVWTMLGPLASEIAEASNCNGSINPTTLNPETTLTTAFGL